ncbi:hypothetical protein, variant [Puccinia striiformis f. sp. tritici PST-78]|uniref:Uncharacterized protein n=1 Tax=Puccinia striiformis f. sp. tritici PST-78 TaxID=1165861 RepID=A0A0L0V1S3_9BASI|nr:hypothetical protein, variant [Puccinia striiformis f. sp. tritici PST-78]
MAHHGMPVAAGIQAGQSLPLSIQVRGDALVGEWSVISAISSFATGAPSAGSSFSQYSVEVPNESLSSFAEGSTSWVEVPNESLLQSKMLTCQASRGLGMRLRIKMTSGIRRLRIPSHNTGRGTWLPGPARLDSSNTLISSVSPATLTIVIRQQNSAGKTDKESYKRSAHFPHQASPIQHPTVELTSTNQQPNTTRSFHRHRHFNPYTMLSTVYVTCLLASAALASPVALAPRGFYSSYNNNGLKTDMGHTDATSVTPYGGNTATSDYNNRSGFQNSGTSYGIDPTGQFPGPAPGPLLGAGQPAFGQNTGFGATPVGIPQSFGAAQPGFGPTTGF